MPVNDQTSAWAMYDLWFNNWNDEVMIQYDFSNNGDCTPVATAQFGGSNGVPVQTWHLCDFTSPGDSGATLDWKLGSGEGADKQSESSGSIDIKAMIEWLEDNTAPAANGGGTYLPAGSTWTALSDGWEICSTGGQNETFSLSGFSVDTGVDTTTGDTGNTGSTATGNTGNTGSSTTVTTGASDTAG